MTPGEPDQRLAGIGRPIRPEYLGRHAVGEIAQLTDERAPLVEQPLVQAAIGEEPEEGSRLAYDPTESLAPGEREQARRHDQEHEEQQRPPAGEAPDQPALDGPEQ